jgi:hypothetical protein
MPAGGKISPQYYVDFPCDSDIDGGKARRAFRKWYVDEKGPPQKSLADIADIVGVSHGAIVNALSAGRKISRDTATHIKRVSKIDLMDIVAGGVGPTLARRLWQEHQGGASIRELATKYSVKCMDIRDAFAEAGLAVIPPVKRGA